jgi:hypothetical protein
LEAFLGLVGVLSLIVLCAAFFIGYNERLEGRRREQKEEEKEEEEGGEEETNRKHNAKTVTCV